MQDDLAQLIRQQLISLPHLEVVETDHKLIEHEKVTIHNEMWKCKGLRKIHLERATLEDRLKIVHCVFYTDPENRIPIFWCDIIETPKQVTAAIVDISPVHGVSFDYQLAPICDRYHFTNDRSLPQWAEEVFSPYCKFARLNDDQDKRIYLDVTKEYLREFVKYVRIAEKDYKHKDWISIMKRIDYQSWYCTSQRKNKKTKAVLTQWFDEEWADNYINNVLFDKPFINYGTRLQSV